MDFQAGKRTPGAMSKAWKTCRNRTKQMGAERGLQKALHDLLFSGVHMMKMCSPEKARRGWVGDVACAQASEAEYPSAEGRRFRKNGQWGLGCRYNTGGLVKEA